MPLTEKGAEIKKNMQEQYGEEKGERVFYASKNAGTISGVDQVATIASSAARFAGGKALSALGGEGPVAGTVNTMINPARSVSTQTQAQENAIMGRPANAGPFGGTPTATTGDFTLTGGGTGGTSDDEEEHEALPGTNTTRVSNTKPPAMPDVTSTGDHRQVASVRDLARQAGARAPATAPSKATGGLGIAALASMAGRR